MKFKSSFYSVFADSPLKNDGSLDTILYSTRTGTAIVITNEQAALMKENSFSDLPSWLLDKLVKAKLIVPEFENEFETCLTENKNFLSDSQTLSYTIQPTGNCQLGCGYCGQLHRNVTMSQQVMDDVYKRIESFTTNSRFTHLDITWYGGEPLMAAEEIAILSRRLIALAKEKNIRYTADMITNGFILSGPKLSRLVEECQVKAYQVTLDGLPEYHDKSRPTKQNRGSFEKIYSNIKAFAFSPLFEKNKVGLTIRLNINRFNAEGVIPFMDFLHAEGLTDKVSLDFQGIVDWGNNQASVNSFSITEFATREIEWMVHGLNKGFDFDGLVPKRQYGVCMVVDKNSEVYDATGNVYPCYELPYTPGFEDGRDLIGNLAAPGKDKNSKDVPLRNWNENVKDPKYGCNTCAYFPVCGGGCPKSWYAGSVPCPSFKFNMDQRLLIQAVRQGMKTTTLQS
jgi:uncharacterized protein